MAASCAESADPRNTGLGTLHHGVGLRDRSGYRCLGDFAAAFFLRPNRMGTGLIAPTASTFSTARFRLFDRGVTSRRNQPTATFTRPPRLNEPDGVSSAVPMAATSTSRFFFLPLGRVLVSFAVAVRLGLAFLAIRATCHVLQYFVQHAKKGIPRGARTSLLSSRYSAASASRSGLAGPHTSCR
jgi:hypothetical protein